MNREAFLARIRHAATVGRQYRVDVQPIPTGAGYVGAKGDLCDALASEVAFVGGEPQVVTDWPGGREAVGQLLRHYHARSVLRWQHAALDRLQLSEVLSEQGIAEYRHDQLAALSEEERRTTVLAAEVGISSVDFAIAETGSLAVAARPGQERVISLVPPVHIAVVARNQIIPDLFDLFRELNARGLDQLPSNLVLISGPSKTGDIELELTTGVHGPGKWHVVIVRESMGE